MKCEDCGEVCEIPDLIKEHSYWFKKDYLEELLKNCGDSEKVDLDIGEFADGSVRISILPHEDNEIGNC